MMVQKSLTYPVLTTLLVLACWPVAVALSQSPSTAIEQAPRSVGNDSPCVLLQNSNVLFGDAYQVGEFVVVRTGSSGEIRLPRSAVACWAASIRDLYQYRKDHRLTGDLATHLREARWCLRYDLFDLAAEEIREVRKVDPTNREAQRIEDQLRRLTSASSPAPPVSGSQMPELQRVGFQESESEREDVDPVALRLFARHIQPMLLSRCSRCHDASSRVEGWNLVVPTVGTRASARMTRENLASSMQYVDAGAIEQSELFIKATNPHGGSGVLLGSRNAKAIDSLLRWIGIASSAAHSSNGRWTHQVAATPTPAAVHDVAPPVQDVSPPAVDGSPPVETPPALNRRDDDGPPARLPQVSNPFDPEIFNRRFHLDSSNAK